jgi:hypothetical protein
MFSKSGNVKCLGISFRYLHLASDQNGFQQIAQNTRLEVHTAEIASCEKLNKSGG